MGEWLLSREGQADRSQPRSAWAALQRAHVPEGRSNVRIRIPDHIHLYLSTVEFP